LLLFELIVELNVKFLAPGDPNGVVVDELDVSIGVATSESILVNSCSIFCSISSSSSCDSKYG